MNHAAKVNQEVAIWSNVGNKGYQAATPLTEGDISMKELQHNPIHPPEAISQSTNSSYPSTQLNPILGMHVVATCFTTYGILCATMIICN